MAEVVRDIKKRVGHRLVVFHSGEALKIPHALFRLKPLKAGEEVNLQAYLQQIRAEENRYALEAAVRMLEMRDRSCQEVYQKLDNSGFSGPAAAAAVARLIELGYLNDGQYARQTARRLNRKYGSIRIRQELRSKGVKDSLIEEALTETDPEDQLEAAVAIARKSYFRKQDQQDARYRRAYAALGRRGYIPEVVREALNRVVAEEQSTEPSAGE